MEFVAELFGREPIYFSIKLKFIILERYPRLVTEQDERPGLVSLYYIYIYTSDVFPRMMLTGPICGNKRPTSAGWTFLVEILPVFLPRVQLNVSRDSGERVDSDERDPPRIYPRSQLDSSSWLNFLLRVTFPLTWNLEIALNFRKSP